MDEKENTIYTYEEAFEASKKYFDEDELAAKVFVDKYALRDRKQNILEDTPVKMFERIATEIARIEKKKFKKPMSYEEIYDYIKDFKYIILQGGLLSGVGNKYQFTSLASCFTIDSPLDSYPSICKADAEIVNISRRRGGCGVDVSNLRPIGSSTQNAAMSSTGIVPFCERYSNTIREVGQNSRRGALIITLSVHHPEILNFINMKKDLSKITGANVSIRLTDEFLNAVEKKEKYEQRFPVEGKKEDIKISNTVDAEEIWNEIIKSSWSNAEPGLLLWNNILKESVPDCYDEYGFKTIGVNPCIIGDTKIMTDKGEIPISEIIEKGIEKYKVLTYNIEEDKVELEDIIWGEKTRENTDVIEIELDDNTKITLTPDHKIYTKDRGYIKASDLDNEDIIIKIK